MGAISWWWWQFSDNIFLLNIPRVVLGDFMYRFFIQVLGDPFSPQAHFSIPWFLRIPQVYAPTSVIYWYVFGLITQLLYDRLFSDYYSRAPTCLA
jgi:hypothetical protein